MNKFYSESMCLHDRLEIRLLIIGSAFHKIKYKECEKKFKNLMESMEGICFPLTF